MGRKSVHTGSPVADAPRVSDRAKATWSDSSLTEICRFFTAARQSRERLVVATIVRTQGSTYRKAGAQILIGEKSGCSGLLGGGCLENDLLERAARVLEQGRPGRVVFDTRGESSDPVFGLGLGCEGANDIWLQPAVYENGYATLPYLHRCLEESQAGMVATIVGGEARPAELGLQAYPGIASDDPLVMRLSLLEEARPAIRSVSYDGRMLDVFVLPIFLPPALLVCGGGPDARPVTDFASALGWRVTLCDHRPAFATPANFPGAVQVVLMRPGQLADRLRLSLFDAAVIMSHHLPSDIEYLRALSTIPPQYIGLLGPAARRDHLLAQVGPCLDSERIHGPAGLDIGSNSASSIALAIIAQIHAVLAGRVGDGA
jgi:xanthine dehydrogenase accessory factor